MRKGKMRLFSVLLWLLQIVQVLNQSETCKSNVFQVFLGYRLKGTAKAEFPVKSAVICAMRCVKEKYCRCCIIIANGHELKCLLYDVDSKNPNNIIKDKRATLYSVIDDKDDSNKSKVTTERFQTVLQHSETTSLIQTTPTTITVTSLTTLTSHQVLVSPSPSLPPSPSPSLPVLSLSTTSAVQNNIAPVACQRIFKENPSSADGDYAIFQGTENVFCDMTGALTGCGGGGWTLAMKINGQRDTFEYSSFRWSNKNDYQPYFGKNLLNNEETKLATYWSTRFTKICLGMSYNGNRGWAIIEVSSSSLFDLISSGVHTSTALPVSKWKDLIDGETSLQASCRIQGINVARGDTGARIGIIATKTCSNNGDYNSRLGFGTKGTSCGQGGTNTCGNEARCDAKPRDLSKKTFGYILVK